ncbi:MAG: hypothetical protein AAGM22_21500 [Acidobacteriota bacterium]
MKITERLKAAREEAQGLRRDIDDANRAVGAPQGPAATTPPGRARKPSGRDRKLQRELANLGRKVDALGNQRPESFQRWSRRQGL